MTTTTSPLPDGLPGFAVSPINERLDAVDGDDGKLWVRHPGKPVFRPLTAPDMWRFRAARYDHHGWWCNAAAHLQCATCLRSDARSELVEPVRWHDGSDAA